MEQYRKAGLAAESARLELEFCEKRKQKNKKPAATQDDDRKVQRALRTEEIRIKADTIDRIKELFAEIVTVCTDARNKFNEIDSVFDCWMSIVMKDNSADKSITQGSKISIGSIENNARGTIARLNLMKSE